MANQPAILLGHIVETVGSTPALQGTTSLSSPIASTEIVITTKADKISSTSPLPDVGTVYSLLTLIRLSIVSKEVCTIRRKYLIKFSSISLQKTAFFQQVKHLLTVQVDALQDQRVGSLVIEFQRTCLTLRLYRLVDTRY